MQIFPIPPTDSLYKFMAITGSWLMTLVVALFMFIGYINYDFSMLNAEQHSFRSSKIIVEDIAKRKESIANGQLSENILSWVPVSDGSEVELSFLEANEAIQQERLSELKSRKKIDYIEWFNLVEATGAIWFIYGVTAIGWFCFYFGFSRWYKNVQKRIDESLVHEVKIKDLTIRKLEYELALARKPNRARFTRR